MRKNKISKGNIKSHNKKNTANSSGKRKRKFTFVTILQSIYLTGNFYFANNLVSSASACAFGFLFSFIPTIMMILVVLIRVLHASPETVTSFLNSLQIFSSTFDLNHLVTSITSVTKITNFEIVLAFAIIWMARRFFSSVMNSLNSIFKTVSKPRPVFSQILIFAGEAVIVVAMASIIFVMISFKALHKTMFFETMLLRFPKLLGSFSSLIVSTVPIILIWLITMLFYKEGSGSKPTWALCAITSGGCAFCFWVFQRLMGLFINVNRYNLLYGVLSNVIVLLIEVYFFFMLFLFFAQYIFVFQFFDILLLGELYVLPDRDDTSVMSTVKRLLFIRPDYLMNKDVNVIHRKKGEYIYRSEDTDTCAYYISRGTVEIIRKNNLTFIDRGKFFGEESCILNDSRNEDAKVHTDVELVKISGDTFLALLEKNPEASRKALSQISSYYAKVYGLRDGFRL
ncbi:MAG: YhjD/YihY/BrkB family envelope integrity protein [Treponema sp.]